MSIRDKAENKSIRAYYLENQGFTWPATDMLTTLGISGGGPEKLPDMQAQLIGHLQILIRGIALHAIEGDPLDLREMQQRMSAIADSLHSESSPDDLLVVIGKTLRVLEDYNRRAAIVFKGQVEELRLMLSTMTETVMFITSSSEMSVKQLSAIESRLQRITNLEDMRQVKTHLTECLSLVRSESVRLQAESRDRINSLKGDVELLVGRLKAIAVEDSQDSVTGLPGRMAAEEAIKTKIAAGKEFVAALFVLDRMGSINGRFGRSVGDEIMVTGAHTLAQKLTGTTLYRWSGPAFAAIFDPAIKTTEAESGAQQAASARIEKSIDMDHRSVLIIITYACHLQRIAAKTLPETVIRGMDAFLAAHGGLGANA